MSNTHLHLAEQVCKLFQQWDVTESLPKKGQQVVVNFPPSAGVKRIAVVKRTDEKSTYGKPLYSIEFSDSLLTAALREQLERIKASALLSDFIFRHECRSYGDAYVAALRILGEPAKEQWVTADVIEAVWRASDSPSA